MDGDATDISNSPAFVALDALLMEGKLSQAVVDMYKSKYAQLHDYVISTYEREKSLLTRAKVLNQELLGERIQLEKQSIHRHEELQALSNLEKEKELALKELHDCEERDMILSYELSHLDMELKESTERLEEMHRENQALVQPEIQRVTDSIASLKEDMASAERAYESEKQRRAEITARIEQVRADQAELEDEKAEKTSLLAKLQNDPERIRKQAAVVEKAVVNLDSELRRLQDKIAQCDIELGHQAAKRKEVEDVSNDLGRKLELHRKTIEQREKEVDTVRKTLDYERHQNQQLLENKVALELKDKEARENLRHSIEQTSAAQKEFDSLKRKIKKKQGMLDSALALLPGLQSQKHDQESELATYKAEGSKLKKKLKEMKQEVDVAIAVFLRQEVMEKDKKEALETQLKVIKNLEIQITKWSAEEHRQNKTIQILSAQREIKAREASKAVALEKETREEVNVKELIIVDLAKKYSETNNRLKEFSALYDVVKNERNKYVNLIQASSQALAEMKEKIKILQNEVEILRNESLAKDRALQKERLSHQTAQIARDQLRLDTNKNVATYRKKQQTVEQQIVEIDKLNSIINGMEKEMLQLKKKYELAVEARNYTGVQLIDRNDELCILYEKANIQEETLKKGEIGLGKVEEEIRMVKLQLAEVQRQIEVTRKHIPNLPEYAAHIVALKEQLKKEEEVTDSLCRNLENPDNTGRWRALPGEDADVETLNAKIQVLEERLNDKKEALLEKELVLEEVTALSDKLRAQASDGRDDTLKLAKRVNEFQARIKEVTRKMMATVSELSMYQATAMKLQQTKHDREMELEDAQWRLEQGQAPTEEAEHAWYRSERERLRRAESASTNGGVQRMSDGMVPTAVVRTTAEPRPNAYIPDEIGIPKPYGALAPFKPMPQGASMRHIKKPNPREIEI
jgi:chromosome segregation ATPase